MFVRWCISVLIFSLTLFGVVSQQQLQVANQEIVLQFQNAKLTSPETAYTVGSLKQQLEGLGAKNINVHSQGNSKLKITYYSSVNVVRIKQILETTGALEPVNVKRKAEKLPFKNTYISYNLDVFEIQQNINSGGDLDGTVVLVLDVKSDRFFNSNQLFLSSLLYTHQDCSTAVAYKVGKDIAIHISNALHTIPEVRAGPSVKV